MWKRLGIVFGVYLLILACGGGSPAPTITTAVPAGQPTPAASLPATAAVADAPTTEAPTAAPAVAKVGDRVELSGVVLTVVKVERADTLGPLKPQAEGNEFLIAEVLVENAGDAQSDYNPFYFKVKDGDGFEYNVAFNTDPQALKSGNLAKGEKARGIVAFEVKKGAAGLVLSYQPISLSLSGTPIRVALD